MDCGCTVDGDTLDVRGALICRYKIQSPKMAELSWNAAGKLCCCRWAATRARANRLGGASVSCGPRETDRHGRTVMFGRKGRKDLKA